MKIENLTYIEFSLIREAINKQKMLFWNESIAPKIKKNVPFNQIQEVKKAFNTSMNEFRVNGICNSILKKLEKEELKAQKELEKAEE